MKKVRCDYKIEENHKGEYDVWISTEDFYLEPNKTYKTRVGAIKALKRLATKLNIELGEEVG